jgi:predicted dehydrogenase
MDMGCYCISVLRTVFGTEPEECMSAQARMNSPEVDEAMKASWRFPNGGVGRIEADLRKSAGWGLPKLDTPAVIVRQKEAELSVGESDVSLRDGQTQFRTRTATLWNFIQPSYWHRIDVVDEHVIKEASGVIVKRWTTKESTKAYTWGDLRKEGTVRPGEDYWTTYRHMLEEFVNKIKGRPGSGLWFSGEDSIKQMQVIDGAYEKAGLPLRPTSTYQ